MARQRRRPGSFADEDAMMHALDDADEGWLDLDEFLDDELEMLGRRVCRPVPEELATV